MKAHESVLPERIHKNPFTFIQMTIDNQILNSLDCTFYKEDSIEITNSVVGILNFEFTTFSGQVIIRNCVINELLMYAAWFEKGFVLEKCVIRKKVQFETAGKHESGFIIKGNLFKEWVIFFDNPEDNNLVIQNNIFCKGNSLEGLLHSYEEDIPEDISRKVFILKDL